MKRKALCALLAALTLLGGCALYSQPTALPSTTASAALEGTPAASTGSTAAVSTTATAIQSAGPATTETTAATVPATTATTTTAATTASTVFSGTGWLKNGGKTYYYLSDGTPAQGRLVIDGQTHFFSSTGEEVLLVNPWNYVPADYEPDLVVSAGGGMVTRDCDKALRQMLADCEQAGHETVVCSAYRTQSWQQKIYDAQIQTQLHKGLSYEEAVIAAGKVVAVPGTSEHQLGLAVDIMDADYQYLNSRQADMPAQQWLMEHCWEYGFILRYPKDKTAVTGIIYEPWHYRYVGTELASELHTLGLCLEEYIDMLTA